VYESHIGGRLTGKSQCIASNQKGRPLMLNSHGDCTKICCPWSLPGRMVIRTTRTSWIHFCFKNILKNAIQTNGPENPSKPPLSLGGYGFPSNTPIPWLTPLTIPNGISIDSCNFAQLCHKVPIGYNGMPHIYSQNCPFLFDNLHPI